MVKFPAILFVLFLTPVAMAQPPESGGISNTDAFYRSPDSAVSSIPVDSYPRGFSAFAGRTFSYSSFSNYVDPGYDFYLGFGYNASPRLFLCLKILTGAITSVSAQTQPLAGKFAVGGGMLELIYRFAGEGRYRPLVSAGYGLTTILTSPLNSGLNSSASGYNGRVLNLQAGVDYYPSRFLSFAAAFDYQYRYYSDFVNDGDFQPVSRTTIDRVFGLNISCFVHFNLVP